MNPVTERLLSCVCCLHTRLERRHAAAAPAAPAAEWSFQPEVSDADGGIGNIILTRDRLLHCLNSHALMSAKESERVTRQ
jgi:hypothetical protein